MKELFLNTNSTVLVLGVLWVIFLVLWIIALSFREEISKGFVFSLAFYMVGLGLFMLKNIEELYQIFSSALIK